jgi:hypothetical protein
MLKRLDGEEARLQDLVSAGELTPEAEQLGGQKLNKHREELSHELRALKRDPVGG